MQLDRSFDRHHAVQLVLAHGKVDCDRALEGQGGKGLQQMPLELQPLAASLQGLRIRKMRSGAERCGAERSRGSGALTLRSGVLTVMNFLSSWNSCAAAQRRSGAALKVKQVPRLSDPVLEGNRPLIVLARHKFAMSGGRFHKL